MSSADDQGTDSTLAGDYVLTISKEDADCSWALFPIEQVTEGKVFIADGAKAMDSLNSPISSSLEPFIVITCVPDESDHRLQVSVSEYDESSIDQNLLAVLQRILVQWTANRQTTKSMTDEWTVSLGDSTDIVAGDLKSEASIATLFSDIFDTSSSSLEWVEMVTGTGAMLGKVPRPLVHKFNLLHRGIGLFVTKDSPMEFALSSAGGDDFDFPDLYTHRRAAIKRIFPSLYDMFVGGVSLVDEPPELTARREVAEELGLSRALTDDDSWSDPILVCTVCTAYNRCVVTLFSYTMDSKKETVAWQEEEVDWGNFVPYPIIASAADRSIQRFADKKEWPGNYPPVQSERKGAKPVDVSYENEDWMEWDFVPDGLLVWEAWLRKLDEAKAA